MSFIEHLMRGGAYGHYWTKQSKQTLWWPSGSPPPIPASEEDIYFGVHPSKVKKGLSERVLSQDIAAINCLYADIDSKDFDDSKVKAAAHVKSLAKKPSVIIDSGGGYHCYWLLREPFLLNTDFKLEVAQSLQQCWVSYVGGDKAVHDLARILRLPGTLNYKYDPPRQVQIAHSNLNRLYDINELEALLPVDAHRGEEEDAEPDVPAAACPNDLGLQEIVDRAQASANGEKFTRLWRGWSEGFASASEADLAFCAILAFWTGGDYNKIDKLFRASDRMRDKWEREDYRHETIIKALGQVTEHYIDPGGFLTAGAHDEGNAQCVFSRCKGQFSYCGALGWLHYTGSYWATEAAEAEVERKIISVLKQRRAAAATAENPESEKSQEAIIRAAKPSSANVLHCKVLLKSLLTVPISSFDTSLDELNCPNGILDLRTGVLKQHSLSSKFTYCLPIPYDPASDQSSWKSWLLEAVGGQQEVVDYLQLAVGYSLTGRTREECFFYVYGPPRAGKGVFTETILTMLGGRPLATEVGMETFVEKRGPGTQGFDLAGLKATRFVAAAETEEKHWLKVSKLKGWTGGNFITCAHKYGNPFTYKPQFKIWLVSNFPIQMDVEDTAGWVRAQVIEFPNSFTGQEDKTLKEKMRSPEVLAGVLAWAVEGAAKWYKLPKYGLRPPKIITEATERARADLDWVAEWVGEEIEPEADPSANGRIPCSVYYQRYEDWCRERGVTKKSLRGLNQSLKRLGYEVSTLVWLDGKMQRCWVGVKLCGTSFRENLARMDTAG